MEGSQASIGKKEEGQVHCTSRLSNLEVIMSFGEVSHSSYKGSQPIQHTNEKLGLQQYEINNLRYIYNNSLVFAFFPSHFNLF